MYHPPMLFKHFYHTAPQVKSHTIPHFPPFATHRFFRICHTPFLSSRCEWLGEGELALPELPAFFEEGRQFQFELPQFGEGGGGLLPPIPRLLAPIEELVSLGAESHLPQGEEHRVDNAHELTLSLADAGGLRAAAVGTTAGGLFAVLAVVAVARFWGGGGVVRRLGDAQLCARLLGRISSQNKNLDIFRIGSHNFNHTVMVYGYDPLPSGSVTISLGHYPLRPQLCLTKNA